MDYQETSVLSGYKTISIINEPHKIYLVKHEASGKFYVKKILDVYNIDVYKKLKDNPVTGVPKLIELEESGKQLTIIEEFISGSTLGELIAQKSLTREKIIQYLINLCDIVEQMHNLKPPVIHRDIKPSNVIITSYDKVILLDFNAAKYFSKNAVSDTVLLGTEGYAAPEQYGFGSSTPQTDIYSIGVLLKEMASSMRMPSASFDSIIECCMQMNPKDRFRDIDELREALISLDKKGTYSHLYGKKRLLPPGFRTKTPWKMVLSSAVYILLLWLCLTVEFDNTTPVSLWIERLFSLAIFLSAIFGTFNYRNIQRFMPLCKNKNPVIHYAGVLILDAVMAGMLFIIMVIIISTFFAV